MAKCLFCFLAIVSILQCAGALPPYDYEGFALKGSRENASFYYRAEHPLKFQSFYPQLQEVLHEASTGSCLVSLQAYEGNLTARTELTKYGGVGNYCYLHNDCILATIYQSTLANMAAATVLLGLTPTILANIGPAIAEIALLSSRRPLLSLLLSMGAPATFTSRFLQFDNPVHLLHRPERPNISRVPFRLAIAVSFLQYAFAVLAITNLIAASVELGRKTVVSWRCSISWLPLMWALTPMVCHAPAVLSFEVYRRKVKSSQYIHRVETEQDANMQRSAKDLVQKSLPFQQTSYITNARFERPRSQSSLLHRAVRSEFTISANGGPIPIAKTSAQPGVWSIILQGTASLFGILQIIFGTVVFSSLLYIGVEDATILLLRYATSAIVCRLIMYLELEGLILAAQDKEEKSHNNEN